MPKTRCPLLPLGTRVVVERESVRQVGSLVLVNPEAPSRGTVLAIGPDVEELRLKDRVVFKRNVATTVMVGERQWLLLRESDILCRVE